MESYNYNITTNYWYNRAVIYTKLRLLRLFNLIITIISFRIVSATEINNLIASKRTTLAAKSRMIFFRGGRPSFKACLLFEG